jgi:hypothetical protein
MRDELADSQATAQPETRLLGKMINVTGQHESGRHRKQSLFQRRGHL